MILPGTKSKGGIRSAGNCVAGAATGSQVSSPSVARSQRPLQGLAVFHCGAPELVELIEPQLRADHPGVELLVGQLGAVVGTYSGPGGVGIALLRAG